MSYDESLVITVEEPESYSITNVDSGLVVINLQSVTNFDIIISDSDPWVVEFQQYGFSAYDLAVQNGYVGTVEQWLESLQSGMAEAYNKTIGYDGQGRVVTITNDDTGSVLTRTFDVEGRVATQSRMPEGWTKTYQYDAEDRVTKILVS